jgi:hypothetical protein
MPQSSDEVTTKTRATKNRSIVKAITYRAVILCLDFVVVYLLRAE